MPYVLPRSLGETDDVALVLAFGRLSVLEVCCSIQGVRGLEVPSERVCVAKLGPGGARLLTTLAGVHKFSGRLVQTRGDDEAVAGLAESIAETVGVRKFALSGYDVPPDDYEAMLRVLLDAFRERGLRRIRLLRPDGNELMAEQVLSRDALDIISFPYHDGYCLGPTAWVSDVASIRARATAKPSPRPEVSMSPRLARSLVNISAVSPGQTLLDPFCGSGTILAEGLSKSLTCLGVDSDPARVREARRNLGWTKRRGSRGTFDLRTGDATDLPSILGSVQVDGVVTEPVLLPRLKARPSDAVAGELVEAAGDIYARALSSISEVLRPGGRVVVVVPVLQTMSGGEVSMDLDARGLGLTLLQPGPIPFRYPVRLSFESTRWIRRAVYVFESRR